MKLGKRAISFTEPRIIRKHYYHYPVFPLWSHVVSAVILVVFTVLVFVVRPTQDTFLERMALLGMGFLFSVLGGYGIAWLDQLNGSSINIGRAGIERFDSVLHMTIPILLLIGYRRYHWKWNDITRVVAFQDQLEGKDYIILAIYGHDDQPMGYAGLGQKTAIEDVVSRIEANGGVVEVMEDTPQFEGL